ncbi:MAG: ATPase, partial [Actinomyces sp.]|nr:ATPase [Actinomyces sp.]
MSLNERDATEFAEMFAALVDAISLAVLDKKQAIRLTLTTLFAG